MRRFKTFITEDVLPKLDSLKAKATDALNLYVFDLKTADKDSFGDAGRKVRQTQIEELSALLTKIVNVELEKIAINRSVDTKPAPIVVTCPERLANASGTFDPSTRTIKLQLFPFYRRDQVPQLVTTLMHEFVHSIQPFLTPELVKSGYSHNDNDFIKTYLSKIESIPVSVSIISNLLIAPETLQNPNAVLRYIDMQMKDELDDTQPYAMSGIGMYFLNWMEKNGYKGYDVDSKVGSAFGQIRHLIAGGRFNDATRAAAMRFGLKLKDMFAREVARRRVK